MFQEPAHHPGLEYIFDLQTGQMMLDDSPGKRVIIHNQNAAFGKHNVSPRKLIHLYLVEKIGEALS